MGNSEEMRSELDSDYPSDPRLLWANSWKEEVLIHRVLALTQDCTLPQETALCRIFKCLKNIYLFLNGKGTHMPWCTCGGHRTACGT